MNAKRTPLGIFVVIQKLRRLLFFYVGRFLVCLVTDQKLKYANLTTNRTTRTTSPLGADLLRYLEDK